MNLPYVELGVLTNTMSLSSNAPFLTVKVVDVSKVEGNLLLGFYTTLRYNLLSVSMETILPYLSSKAK